MRVNHVYPLGLLCASLSFLGCNNHSDVTLEGQGSPAAVSAPTPQALVPPQSPARAISDRWLVSENQNLQVNVLDNDEHNDGTVVAFGLNAEGQPGTPSSAHPVAKPYCWRTVA